MKKLFRRFFAAASAFALLMSGSGGLQASSSMVDVIVTLEIADDADPAAVAAAYAEAVTERFSLVSDFTYDTLFCGFHLLAPEALLPLLAELDGVQSIERCGSYEPLAEDAAMLNLESAADAAAELISLSDSSLTGEGIKIAVIDNGFTITHPAFAGSVTETLDLAAISNGTLTKRLSVMRYVDSVEDFYYNSKIPFRFDYASKDLDVSCEEAHGTHVAGIIGAMPTEEGEMQGVAPGCQLLLMKIFEDSTASDQVLLAAMEDALRLGADIVNLSLGRYSGSAESSQITGLDAILEKMREAGCLVMTAVGNDQTAARYSSVEETTLPPASYTDYGTISTPAASEDAIAVTSANNRYDVQPYFRHSDSGACILYSDTNLSTGVVEEDFTTHFDGQVLEYVVVPGIGEEADYETLDVAGKLALIQRGITSFVEKVNLAAEHGALGVIIYNNVEEESLNVDITGATIPAIAIRMEDGEQLASASKRFLRFDRSYQLLTDATDAGQIASYASRGVTPSLTLKPDLTAVGSDIYSTVPQGYGFLSGTSMAAPQISGVAALLLEQLHDSGITGKDAAEEARVRLMNTAIPIVQQNGVETSPRSQGAGLVNAAAACQAELRLTYAQNGKPKAELYDLIGDFIYLDLVLENLTDLPLTVTLSATLSTDGYTTLEIDGKEEYFNTLEAVSDSVSRIEADGVNLNRHAEDYSPLSLTLAPGKSYLVPIVLEFDEAYHDALDEIFVNGHFIDGFVYAETELQSYSLPYMGYKGDWAAAPILDSSYYEDSLNLFGGTLFTTSVDSVLVALEAWEDSDCIAFSPNQDGLGDRLFFSAKLLRNVHSSVFTLSNEDGELLYTRKTSYLTKSNGVTDSAYSYSWHGGDGLKGNYTFPDGRYRLTVTYTLDYRKNLTQTYEYTVQIDTKKPRLTQLSYDGTTLFLAAEDESLVKTIYICENAHSDAFSARVDGDHATFDLSEYDGDTLYYEIIDHALNTLVGKISLSDLLASSQETPSDE